MGAEPNEYTRALIHRQRESGLLITALGNHRKMPFRPPAKYSFQNSSESVDNVENAGLTTVEPVDNPASSVEGLLGLCYHPILSGGGRATPTGYLKTNAHRVFASSGRNSGALTRIPVSTGLVLVSHKGSRFHRVRSTNVSFLSSGNRLESYLECFPRQWAALERWLRVFSPQMWKVLWIIRETARQGVPNVRLGFHFPR